MRLIFARHGQSEANVLRIMSNRDLPHGLTPLGWEQAAALARRMVDEAPTALYCSPMLRARQTASAVESACGLTALPVEALREPDCGDVEGRGDPEAWRVHDETVARWMAGDPNARPPGGDSLNEVRARFLPFIDGLVGLYRATEATIALVAHGSLLTFMLPELCANVPLDTAARLGMPNAGAFVIEVRPRGLVCVEWAGQRLDADPPGH